MAHCRYRMRGGEDASCDAEVELLRSRGVIVSTYLRDSREIDGYGPVERLLLSKESVWSSRSRRDVADLIGSERPDVAHFQNTFPLISPSAFAACRGAGVPVVVSLRNYRLVCLKATLLRDGRPCHACVGRSVPWPAIAHACYQGSRARTAVVAAGHVAHGLRGTWRGEVDVFVVNSPFSKRWLVAGGLPADRMVVKPNFCADPGEPAPLAPRGPALFVGRLSEEKGVDDLVRAVSLLKRGLQVRIVGDGPEKARLEALVKVLGLASRVTFAGYKPASEVLGEIGAASCVVLPSRCYETFGRTVVEAFACGRSAVVASGSAPADLVTEGETGAIFERGDAESLAAALERLYQDEAKLTAMGRAARACYLSRYTPEENFRLLMGIYRLAIERAHLELPAYLDDFAPARVSPAAGAR